MMVWVMVAEASQATFAVAATWLGANDSGYSTGPAIGSI